MFRYLLFLLLFCSYSFGCKCFSSEITKDNLDKHLSKQVLEAKDIYTGILVSSNIVNSDLLLSPDFPRNLSWKNLPYIEATLYVKNVIKGNPKKIVKIRTAIHNCGMKIVMGNHYVIFSKEGQNEVSHCDASRKIRWKDDDYLNEVKNLVKKQNEKAILK